LQVTAARLPYFDGDYWPGAAEDMIMQLQQQEEDGRNNALKKGKTKKAASSKRASKAVAQAEMASNASKDTQLMHKLGESILPMKEDFIMVHMHHACSHCRLFIVTGCRWVCGQCKNFQLCDRCGSLSLAHLELIKTWQLMCVVFFLYSFKNTQHDTNIQCVKLGCHASKETEIPWI
jgi:E1A/CREB-binding protein